jgi:curved DNA-binding protein
MNDPVFVDLYEVLELSPSATFETIENMFRYHAKRYHPDSVPTGCQEKFKKLLHAYHTLREPEKRAAYDATYERNRRDRKSLVAGAEATSDDHAVRHRLLSLFYAQRRRNMKDPGLAITTIEELMKVPTELIEFHLWYFREKGWIQRELSGPLSISHAGVDEIESRELKRSQYLHERIEYAPTLRLSTAAMNSSVPN